MSALLRFVNPTGGELVVDAATKRLVEGENLIAELFLSLYTDAPADEGDPVPDGIERHWYWASAFDTNAIRGSKLWILRYVRPVEDALVLAEQWTTDALQHLITRKLVQSISVRTEARGSRSKMILIEITVTLDERTRRTFRLETPYAV
jgi:phage gp46-like protein